MIVYCPEYDSNINEVLTTVACCTVAVQAMFIGQTLDSPA